ncbi:MAG: T9SS type A sorting domain-containing protein, partial [Candidatus Cloacimonetes bacterium]|nr:T9SS type A sorting domain-containing protein [Candidatus Cloacimonadota bacterium]
NSVSLFLWQSAELIPWFLFNDPDLYNEALNQPQVRLFWQAPGGTAAHPNWTHYRIYRNMQLIDTIPFIQSEYTDLTWTGNETTTYSVRAWDGFVESDSSNELYVIIVSNEDQLLKPVTVSMFPNPVAVSQGQNLDIRLSNLKNRNAELKIYNLKGQKVHSAKLTDIETYTWNGKDVNGKACAAGVYFLKVQVHGEKPFTRKLAIQ